MEPSKLTITVPYAQSYPSLLAEATPGCAVPGRCTSCNQINTLAFTRQWVARGVCWQKSVGCVFEIIQIPIARCRACRARTRVLPRELLPYKTFSLSVVEQACADYPQSSQGLRPTVARMGPDAPHHSTLHGWLAGMGERGKDRIKYIGAPSGGRAVRPVLALSAVLAETARQINPDLDRLWNQPQDIPFFKFQSERRAEQLEACARLASSARVLFPSARSPLTLWQGVLIERLNVPAWDHSSKIIVTAIQREVDPPPV